MIGILIPRFGSGNPTLTSICKRVTTVFFHNQIIIKDLDIIEMQEI